MNKQTKIKKNFSLININKKRKIKKNFTNAIMQNDINTVKELVLNKQIKPNAYDHLALTTASRLGFSEIVEFLLEQPNFDQSFCSFHAFKLAVKFKNLNVVKILLNDKNIDFSQYRFPEIFLKTYVTLDSSLHLKPNEKKYINSLFKILIENTIFRNILKIKYVDKYEKFYIKKKINNF